MIDDWSLHLTTRTGFHFHRRPDGNEIVHFCGGHGIRIEGFSPLVTGAILHNQAVSDMAQRYGKTVAQICIRYAVQKDVVPLPKSTHRPRILENADVDFKIAAAEMSYLDRLTDTVTVQHGPNTNVH